MNRLGIFPHPSQFSINSAPKRVASAGSINNDQSGEFDVSETTQSEVETALAAHETPAGESEINNQPPPPPPSPMKSGPAIKLPSSGRLLINGFDAAQGIRIKLKRADSPGMMTICVKNVSELKKHLAALMRIPAEQQIITLDGKKLKDTEIFNFSNKSDLSTIKLMITLASVSSSAEVSNAKSNNSIDILIKIVSTGETLAIPIETTKSIGDLKLEMADKGFDFDRIRLIHAGKSKEDSVKISEIIKHRNAVDFHALLSQ